MSTGSGRDPATPSQGVEQALTLLLDSLSPIAPVKVALDDASGLVLAESVVSRELHPADDTSAMDGYAVESSLLREASAAHPIRLTIIEDIQAGYPPQREVGQGQTSRISTGGLIPVGADAVEMREYVEVEEGKTVVFRQPVDSGHNIRRAGEHLQVGEEVLPIGTLMGPSEIGMAAYLGANEVNCHPRLPVAIITTGSELIGDGGQLGRGQIRDSNGVALATAVRQLGCTVVYRQRVADNAAALDHAIGEAAQQARVLLTSGGISAGWHDLVRQRIEGSGGTFRFHKLRMRPGKPIAFGQLGQTFVFCLPGNPVSSLVTFEIFVKPALLKLMGRPVNPAKITAKLTDPLSKKAGFTVFFRVKLETGDDGSVWARLTGPQGSHQLKSMVEADGLAVAHEAHHKLRVGDQVEVLLLR